MAHEYRVHGAEEFLAKTSGLDDTTEQQANGIGQPNANGNEPLPVTSAFPIDPKSIPARAWIVIYLLLRAHITFLAAPPSVGKSLLSLQLAIACALGIAWGKWKARKPCKVLVVNIEDDHDELRRRLWCAAMSMGVDQTALEGRILLVDASAGLVVAKTDRRSKTVIAQPSKKRLEATIRKHDIDLTIIDPFAETFEGDENSNSEIKWVGTLYRSIARQTNSCILLVAHTRKGVANGAGDPDTMRGAGALQGIGRVVVTLFPMTPLEGEALGIDPAERNRFVRFDDGKVNFSLKDSSSIPGNAVWLRKLSIQMPNGDGEVPGDWVGVFEPWAPPKAFAALDLLTLNLILDDIARGLVNKDGTPNGARYSQHKTAKTRWAGNAIKNRAPDTTDHAASTIIRTWVKSGLLYEDEYKDHRRVDVKGLYVNDAKRPGTETNV